jgi:hypothetical protein
MAFDSLEVDVHSKVMKLLQKTNTSCDLAVGVVTVIFWDQVF